MQKWIYEKPFLFSVFYFIFYLAFFFTLERLITAPVWIVHSFVDDLIPFSRFGIIPYCLWFPWIAITILGMLNWGPRSEYLQTCMTMYLGMTLCLIFYCIVPNGLNLRPAAVSGSDLCAYAVRWLYSFDSSLNVCPSLHVYVSVCMDLGWQRSSILAPKKRQWIRPALRILDIAICLSTMFLKQHSFIDVLSGAILAILINALIARWLKSHPFPQEA